MTRTGRFEIAAAYALSALPLLFLLACYCCFSHNLPYLDQWEFVPFLEKAFTGSLSFHDFWAQHNEHRILFPRLIMLGLAWLTDWNIYWELMVNVILGVGILGLAWAQMRRSAAALNKQAEPWLLPLFSMLLLALTQWQNWFLGWQLQEWLNLLCAWGMTLALTGSRLSGWRLFIAAILALVGTYSFANGMLLWPLGLGLIVLQPHPGIRRPVLAAIWAILSIAVIASYLWNYHTPPYHPDPWNALFQPMDLAVYFFKFLGQPVISFHGGGAAIAGALGLAIWGALLLRCWKKGLSSLAYLPWLALGLYSIGSALVTGTARAPFGTDQAMSSRYVTVANPLWIAVVVLLWFFFQEKQGHPIWRHCYRTVLSLFILLYLYSSFYSAYRWTERYNAQWTVREELLTGETPDLLRRFHPEPSVIVERREILERLGLSVFGNSGVHAP